MFRCDSNEMPLKLKQPKYQQLVWKQFDPNIKNEIALTLGLNSDINKNLKYCMLNKHNRTLFATFTPLRGPNDLILSKCWNNDVVRLKIRSSLAEAIYLTANVTNQLNEYINRLPSKKKQQYNDPITGIRLKKAKFKEFAYKANIPWIEPNEMDLSLLDHDLLELLHVFLGIMRNSNNKYLNDMRLVHTIPINVIIGHHKNTHLKVSYYNQLISKHAMAPKDKIGCTFYGPIGLQIMKTQFESIGNILNYIESQITVNIEWITYDLAWYFMVTRSYIKSMNENRKNKPNTAILEQIDCEQCNLLDFAAETDNASFYSPYASQYALETTGTNIEHVLGNVDGYGMGPYSSQIIEHCLKVFQVIILNHCNNKGDYYKSILYRWFHLTFDSINHFVIDFARRQSDISSIVLWDKSDQENYDFNRYEDKHPLFYQYCKAIDEHRIGKQIP